jgi:predicted PurR-regulated permease PerM
MPAHDPGFARTVERRFFFVLLAIFSVAFVWVVSPYIGAVLWGSILALLFHPMQQALQRRWKERKTLAALATLAVILLIVVLPLAVVGVSLIQEVAALVARVRSGEVNFGAYFDRVVQALPEWATGLLHRVGLDDLASLQQRLMAGLGERGQALAGRVVGIGSDLVDLVVSFFLAMYLLFFLLQDGHSIARRVRDAIPLAPDVKSRLLERFLGMIRAAVKGNVVVAIVQGTLGGLAFWFLGVQAPLLWAIVMAFASLIPAVGAALIWAPVAIYFVAIGQVVQGVGLVLWGTLVIGLVDNVLRPILVGADTKMPDYLVLITTVGGLVIFGIHGFVVGPVVAALFLAAWQQLTEDRQASELR